MEDSWPDSDRRDLSGPERNRKERVHMELGRSELLKAYRTMKMIREFEERIHVEFATGEIPGFVHLYAVRKP
jgi:TPP-dependent pyruvate/acetoin dehydrogenase alpha subunit